MAIILRCSYFVPYVGYVSKWYSHIEDYEDLKLSVVRYVLTYVYVSENLTAFMFEA